MTWSSSGSAATYPSYVPTLNANFRAPPAGDSPLTVRIDPQSKIVYVVGAFTVAGVSGSTYGALYLVAAANPLPPQFCPASRQWALLFAQNRASTVQTVAAQINTDGTVYIAGNISQAQPYALNAHYLTDV